VINWVGVRPPAWPAANANGTHTYGDPVSLFDGTTMDAWGVQHKQRPINWSVADGVMSSADKGGNNLVSTQTFDDFKIEAEYAIAAGSNGGIYVRGRYELQLLDDAGQPVTPQSHMAIYGRTPPAVNASRPAGEWQRMEAVVVGNRVTVTLNGQKVHDNAVIEGITGGALDANEAAPGPIMLQGDHGKVMFRKVVVTPIKSGGESVQYRSPPGVEYRALPDTNAIKTARAALAADPKNVAKIIALGVAESGARQFREAIATFTRGLEIEPNNALLLRWRGHRYLSVRAFDRAYADLTRGTKIDPSIYGLWYHLGVVQFVRGEFAVAAESFATAQPIAPDAGELAGSTDWLWMSLSRAGRTADAKAMLDRRPDNKPVTNAYTRRLQLYRGEIGPEAVIAAADTEDVQLATLAYGLGNWHLVRGDTAQARAAFERAVQSGGWPAFGFIAAEAELRRRAPAR
jgi:tetratricopeptide (TPR) repeat protein